MFRGVVKKYYLLRDSQAAGNSYSDETFEQCIYANVKIFLLVQFYNDYNLFQIYT